VIAVAEFWIDFSGQRPVTLAHHTCLRAQIGGPRSRLLMEAWGEPDEPSPPPQMPEGHALGRHYLDCQMCRWDLMETAEGWEDPQANWPDPQGARLIREALQRDHGHIDLARGHDRPGRGGAPPLEPPADVLDGEVAAVPEFQVPEIEALRRLAADIADDDPRLDVIQRAISQAEREAAQQLLNTLRAEQDVKPLQIQTMSQDLAEEREPQVWTIESLHARGGNTLLSAQAKVGKTTLMENLARSLLDDEPFLGEFKVFFPERRVLYLNYEVIRDRFEQWVRQIGLEDTDRLIALHLRGLGWDLTLPDVQRQLIAACLTHDVGLMIVDPLEEAYTPLKASGDPNPHLRTVFKELNRIKHEGRVDDLFVIDHAGHEHGDRPAGGFSKMAIPDNLWSLTKDRTGIRHFSAQGRDSTIEGRYTLDFDRSTLRLRTAERAARDIDAQPLTPADHALIAVARHPEVRGAAEMRSKVGGIRGQARDEALREAEQLGYIRRRKDGRAFLYEVREEGRYRLDELGAAGDDGET
jgi:hypothetical protein